MATDLERLVVQLSADVRKYERGLDRALGRTNKTAQQIETRFKRMNRGINATFANFGRGLLIGAAGSVGIRALADYADAWTQVQNRLRVVGLEGDELAGKLDDLFAIAQKFGTGIDPLVTLYSRLATAQKELGATSEELTQFTEGVAAALKVAGTDSQSARGALLQLSQAMGSSVVRAEEFNSIMEGARPILQAVADGLEEAGGSVSALRQLVLDGEVSNEAFFRAFLAGMGDMQAKADQAQSTIGQAFQRIENSFTKLIGEIDKSTRISANFVEVVNSVAEAMDRWGGNIAVVTKYLNALNNAVAAFTPLGAVKSILGENPIEQLQGAAAQIGLLTDSVKVFAGETISAADAQKTLNDAFAAFEGGGGATNPVSLRDFAVEDDSDDDKKAKKSRERVNAYQREVEAIRQRTAALMVENEVVGASTFEAEKARAAQELLNAAKEAGLEITPELTAQIDQLAGAYANAAATLEQTQAAFEEMRRLQEDLANALQGALQGFIQDLLDGKDATEALTSALGRLADRLIDIALTNILGSLLGGGGGGLLAGVFHRGGVVGGASAGRVVPAAAFAGAPRMHSGGVAGLKPDEVPAILQRGEIVIPKLAARQMQQGGGAGPANVSITVVTPDAPSFLRSQNQIAAKTAASLDRTFRTR